MIRCCTVAGLLISSLASAFAQSTTCGVEGYKPCDGMCAQGNGKLVASWVLHTLDGWFFIASSNMTESSYMSQFVNDVLHHSTCF